MSKETILAAVNALPAEVEVEELIEKLILLEKIEIGREQSRQEQTVSHEDVKKLAKTWFK